MSGRITPRFLANLSAAALCLAAVPAWAQVCAGPVGPATAPVDGERYGMVAEQCPSLAAPLNTQRAKQLDLYDKPTPSVTIAAPPDPAQAPVTPAISNGKTIYVKTDQLPPPTKGERRVLALVPALNEAAREFNVDPLLLHAVAHVESRHNPEAVSHAGARGVMQMMPATAKRFGVTGPESNLHNPDVNLRASAAYLQQLKQRYGDDLKLTLAAYNAGEGAVAKYGGVPPYPETQDYVRKVMGVYRKLGEAFTVSPTGQLIAKGE